MLASLPPLLSLLAMLFGAALIAYVIARRPNEPSSWALSAVALGLLIYYLSVYALYRPGLALQAGFFWQKLGVLGSGVASIGAVALAFALRESTPPRWERVLALVLVARAVGDMAFVAAMVPRPQPGCLLPSGFPMLHCDAANHIGSGLGLLSVAATLFLFYRTFRLASDARRKIFMRHLLPAALLICLATGMNLLWSLNPRSQLLPTALMVLPTGVLVARMLLELEQTDRGLQLSLPARGFIAWTALLFASVGLDAWWFRGSTPVVSLLVLVAGLVGGLTLLGQRVVSAAPVPSETGSSAPQPLSAEAASPAPRLRIHLFGPFSVERDGEALSNQTKFWRSDKSRSLLAYLALAGEAGVTRNQLVDALWPLPDDGDGPAEQRSLNALRSYLSTVRKVLEPDKPPAGQSVIAHDGDRYRLVNRPDVWVDVWEFARWTAEAERCAAAGEDRSAAAAWERTVILHGELGLLPDEAHLPPETVEPERERLRQQWLRAVRWLARYDAQNGPAERAVTLWESVWRAVPLDDEAYDWLAGYYRRTGQTGQLAALEAARARAALEMGGHGST